MDEYVKSVADKIGVPESVAKAATAKILEFIKDQLADSEFGKLLEKIPGASELFDSDANNASDGGGLLGGLAKAAGGLMGGDAGEGLELFGALDDAGVSADKAPTMAAQFLKMVKEHVDDDLLQSILSQIPALKPFLN